MSKRTPTMRMCAVVGCVATLLTVAACGSDSPTSTTTTSTITVSQTAQTGQAGETAQDTSTAAATQAPADDAGTTTTGPQHNSAAGVSRPVGVPAGLSSADANVNPHHFYNFGGQGYAYYFQSPSGNIKCGIGFPNPYTPEGCQAAASVQSPTGARCGNDGGRTGYISELVRGVVRSHCSSTSVYVGSDRAVDQPIGYVGGWVLQYGQTISASGVTCTSTTAGITCYQGEHGFTLARDRNAIY